MRSPQFPSPRQPFDDSPEGEWNSTVEAPTDRLVRSRRRGSSARAESAVHNTGGTGDGETDYFERPRSRALLQEALDQLPEGRPPAHQDIVRWKIPTGLVTALALLLTACALWSVLSRGSSDRGSVIITGASPSASVTGDSQQSVSRIEPSPAPASRATQSTETVTVHVAGAVVSPGIYYLPSGSLINDAVEAAGGAQPEADVHALNLAETAVTGSRIYVPLVGEDIALKQQIVAVPGAMASSAQPSGAQPININTATASELEQLPKVGPVLAQNIITWREENGGFKSIDELQNVNGIGPATYELLVPLVTL